MHRLTFEELQRTHLIAQDQSKSSVAERPLLAGSKFGVYDYLLTANDGRTIGIEILTRPSQGKLRQKLYYADTVDEFIFVLPDQALSLYLKPALIRQLKTRPKKLSAEFNSPKLKVWLLDLSEKKFVLKNEFNQVYWVEREK